MLDVWKKLKDKCNYFSQNFFLMKHHRHRLKSTYKKCFHCLRFSRILTQLLNFSQTLTLVTMPLCLKCMHVKLHTWTRYINKYLQQLFSEHQRKLQAISVYYTSNITCWKDNWWKYFSVYWRNLPLYQERQLVSKCFCKHFVLLRILSQTFVIDISFLKRFELSDK